MVQLLKNILLLLEHAPTVYKVLAMIAFTGMGFWMGYLTWRITAAQSERLSKQQNRLREEITALKERLERRPEDEKPIFPTWPKVSGPTVDGDAGGVAPEEEEDEETAEEEDDLTVLPGVTPEIVRRLHEKGIRTLGSFAELETMSEEERREFADRFGLGEIRLEEWKPFWSGEPVEAPKDDLTVIRGVTPELAVRLNRDGIRTLRQVADWTPEQAVAVASRLGLGRQIQDERWVDQCRRLLVLGGSLGQDSLEPRLVDDQFPNEPVRFDPRLGVVYSRRPELIDELQRIHGIGPMLEQELHRLGVFRFKQIGLWTQGTVREFGARLNCFPDRMERDQWVEQARHLHAETYARETLWPVAEPAASAYEEVAAREFAGEPVAVKPPYGIIYPVAPTEPDELSRIDGITPGAAVEMGRIGIFRHAQIAHWSEANVDGVAAWLNTVPDRIYRERWIQQAIRLAGEKLAAAGAGPEEVSPGGLEDYAGEPVRVDPELGIVYAVHPEVTDDLTLIEGLHAPDQALLNSHGIFRFRQIAGWTDAVINRVEGRTGLDANFIRARRWVGRAAELHRQLYTEEATAWPVPDPPVEALEDRAGFLFPGGETRADAEFGLLFTSPPSRSDDLSRIEGITEEMALGMARHGVHRYVQIANWSVAQVRAFAGLLGIPADRIFRQRWIGQATGLAATVVEPKPSHGTEEEAVQSGGVEIAEFLPEPTPEPPVAPQPVPGALPSLPSLPSGPPPRDGATWDGAQGYLFRSGRPALVDDLKLIRGVGPVEEVRLQQLGIYRFWQLAEWTQGMAMEIGSRCGFGDRAVREKWIGQAGKLAILSEASQVEAYRARAEVDQAAVVAVEFAGEPVGVDPGLGIVYRIAPAVEDRLTAISGMGETEQAALRRLGIHRFKQVAAWSDRNVAEVARRIGVEKDRVERQKWIPQAVNLQRVIYVASPAWAEDQPSVEAYRRKAAEVFPGEAVHAVEDLGILYGKRPARIDALTTIAGIDAEAEAKLHAVGIYRFRQIANWSARNVAAFAEWFGWHPDRIYRDRWIAQAIELAQRAESEAPGPEPEEPGENPAVLFGVLREHFQEEPHVRVDRRFGVVYGERPDVVDDLSLVGGLAPDAVAKLHGAGVFRFKQMAHWTPGIIRETSGLLGIDPARIEAEQWPEQARRLHHQIYAASPTWSVVRPGLEDYERRMEETYPGEIVGADEELGILYAGRPEAYDDLKRVNGITADVEARLNASGVHRYKQIADWSEANVKAFGSWLGVPPARIYQERWIAQAGRLASLPPLRRVVQPAAVSAGSMADQQFEALERDFAGEPGVRIDRQFGIVYDDSPAVTDDLKQLSGVTPAIEEVLHAHGTFRFKQIAVWTPGNEAEFARVLGIAPDQLRAARWIPLARELHGQTYRSSGAWQAASPTLADYQARIADFFTGEPVRADEALGILYSRRPAVSDDLTRIEGLGEEQARRLNASGVYRFKQIANWSDANVAAFARWIGCPAELISRGDWVGKAVVLARQAVESPATGKKGQINPLARYFGQPGVRWREDLGYVYGERPEVVDDLTRIHGIDDDTVALLTRHGIFRFWQIASWTREVIEVVSGDLDLGNRIKRERWRPQAMVLAQLGCADEDGRFEAPAEVDHFAVMERDFAEEGEVRADPAFGIVYDQRPVVADDLCRINGVTFALEEELHRAGLYRYKQIACWSDGNVAAFAAAAGLAKEQIERERWIPQARWLHLRVYGQGTRWPEPKPVLDRYEELLGDLFPGGSARVDERFGFIYTGRPRRRDDLSRIRGISEALARRLNASGIHTFRQVSWWSDANIRALAKRLGFHPDQVYRGQWIAQAAKFDDELSEEEAVAAGSGEAASGEIEEEDGITWDAELGPVYAERPSFTDDLKAINGVGPKIERMLNGHGVYRFRQIAGWTDAHVAAFSAKLHFRERIQRERWVVQARELAELREAEHRETFFAPAQLDQIAVVERELADEPGVRVDPFLGIVFDQPPVLADDLAAIDGIGKRMERELHQLGVFRHLQIANWTDGNVAHFAENLSCLKDRIERDKWIPQAHRLHRETYSASGAWGEESPSLAEYQARIEEEFPGEAVRPDPELGIVYTGWPSHVDNLQDIVGIDAKMERALNHLGVFCVKQLANWSSANVDAFAKRLASAPQRIYRDRWIFQAAGLSCKEPVPVQPVFEGLDADLRRVLSDQPGLEADERLGFVYRERPVDVDSLHLIKGVGHRLEKGLNGLGIYRFRQIASWSDPQLDEFGRRLGTGIRASNWVGQAREWAALAEAEAARSFVAPAVVDQDAAVELDFAEDAAVRVDERLGIVYDRPPAVVDDLNLISGIGGQMERELNELGVYRFKQIARWSDANVGEFARRLFCQKERIERDKWIPQAKRQQRLLYAACPEWGSVRPSPGEWDAVIREAFSGLPVRADKDYGIVFTGRPRGGDDLKEIGGISGKLEQELNAAGVWTFLQIAWWAPANVEAFARRLQIHPDRIYRDGWVPSARILSLRKVPAAVAGPVAPGPERDREGEGNGSGTVPRAGTAREVARRPVSRPLPAAEPQPVAPPAAAGGGEETGERFVSPARVDYEQVLRQHFSGETALRIDPRWGIVYGQRPEYVDELRHIDGIGPKLEKALQQHGVYRFRQIAHWSDATVAAFAEALAIPKERIERGHWVPQARRLDREAVASGTEWGNRQPGEPELRARVAEEFPGEDVEVDESYGIAYVAQPDQVDNLRLVRGIGEVYADRLNSVGIYRFKQIANWTEANVDAIARLLGTYRDRIYREGWIRQARDLAPVRRKSGAGPGADRVVRAEPRPEEPVRRDFGEGEPVADAELGMVFRTPPREVDDLTKIRGVGRKLENSLNDHGVYTFRQIALWSRRNAEEFALRLEHFGNRMFRDRWIEQAAELHRSKYQTEP